MPTPTPAPDAPATAAALARLEGGAQALWQSLAPWWPGLAVEVVPTIDSTNVELMRRARAGQTDPVVLAAASQSAGRGRLGRSWVTVPGASLALSIGLPLAPADWAGLSLAVGVAVAEALDPAVQLKWPNDLCWQGRKLGGILIETAPIDPARPASRYAVIGIGLNLATPRLPPDAPADALPPIGLEALPRDGGHPAHDIGHWLARVGAATLQAVQDFERAGFAPLQSRYAARDALRGQRVRTSDGGEGIADGVDADGALRLRTPDGVRRVQQGEVSVRPC
jgi:BirA family biotin operon repressor/biotin-[acetyl-CoA-carboxylase] ligase